MATHNILPKITENQYRIIIIALHTLEKQYPKDDRIPELTDLISTQTLTYYIKHNHIDAYCEANFGGLKE